MAAVTAVVVAAAGATLAAYSAAGQGDAAQGAAAVNAQNAEYNAELVKKRALEDERQFRLSFRRDQASNRVAVAASGVRLEGSPLAVLRDNTSKMEEDALKIKQGGKAQEQTYLRQASGYRLSGSAAGRAASVGAAASLLSGAASATSQGVQSGVF